MGFYSIDNNFSLRVFQTNFLGIAVGSRKIDCQLEVFKLTYFQKLLIFNKSEYIFFNRNSYKRRSQKRKNYQKTAEYSNKTWLSSFNEFVV